MADLSSSIKAALGNPELESTHAWNWAYTQATGNAAPSPDQLGLGDGNTPIPFATWWSAMSTRGGSSGAVTTGSGGAATGLGLTTSNSTVMYVLIGLGAYLLLKKRRG